MESAMDVFENRLESFTNWPKGLFLRPQIMAAAGFFHTNWDSDEVQCFNCAIVLDNWQPDDDPFKQHLAAAPNCSFVNKTYMSSLDDRLASFHAWPLDEKPLPIHMAAAGFFHSNKTTDAATCFCCTLRLEQWERADDPIERHMYALRQTQGRRPCTWLDKITTPPEKVSGPTPLRVAARWNHSTPKPHKCSICQTVYSSGNQFHKHLVEAGHDLPRRARNANPPPASGSGVNRPKGVSRRQEQRPAIQPQARERPSTDSNVPLALLVTQPTPPTAPTSMLAREERRRNPPGTVGFLGSHRVMKPTPKSRPIAKVNAAAVSSRMDNINGQFKQEDELTSRQQHEPLNSDNQMEPGQVEETQNGAPQRPPRHDSLIGEYGEPSAPTGWDSTGLASSSSW